MGNSVPPSVFESLQSSAHVGLTLAFTTRGLEVPNDEITEESRAVALAMESTMAIALQKARLLPLDSFPVYDECPLSAKELQAMALRAQGLGRAEIAEKLGITQASVSSRLDNAPRKMPEAKNTTHAMAIAIRAGWI